MTELERKRLRSALQAIGRTGEPADAEPVDPAVEDRLVELLLRQIDAQKRRPALTVVKGEGAPAVAAGPGRRTLLYRLAALPLAAAAIVAVLLLPRHPDRLPPVPELSIQVPGDDSTMGTPARPVAARPGEPARLTRDSLLSVTITPRQPAPDLLAALETRAFLGHVEAAGAEPEEVRPWPVTLERSPQGGFLLRGRVRDLPDLGPGTWDLIFVFARPGHMPPRPPATLLKSEPTPHDFRLVQSRIVVQAP